MKDGQRHCDYLIVGSGIAGLSLALKLARHGKVLIITKSEEYISASHYAQGGIAAAIGDYDNAEKHLEDTLVAGAGLCDVESVKILVNEGIDRVKELIELGMSFTRNVDGQLHLGKEGGHGESRIVHADDFTGREIVKFLLQSVKQNPAIQIMPNVMAIDLITNHHIQQRSDVLRKTDFCYGVYALNEETQEAITITADFTFLASGGGSRIYPYSTNPKICTGDGVAMAFRAGCSVRNLEFFQFHPTALYADVDPCFLISEAVRGHGAKLFIETNEGRRYFMADYHELKELAPRDIVARAIDAELKKHGKDFVCLDISHIDAAEIKEHFPNIYETLLKQFKIDMAQEPVPVVPAAHYMCGGIVVNYDSQTQIQNLFAIGETSSTGVHGGNRLASNSLLEGLVFADRAANCVLKMQESLPNLKEELKQRLPTIAPWNKSGTVNLEEWVLIQHDRKELQSIMWDYVGIVRSKLRLHRALKRIDLLYEEIIEFYNRTTLSRELLELRNLALVAQLTVRCALLRDESRGLHFMTDFPENRNPSRHDTVIEPGREKKIRFRK